MPHKACETPLTTPISGFLDTFLDAIDGSFCTFSAFGQTGDSPIDPVYPDPNPLGYQGKRQCGVYKPTNVISISYGEQEDDIPTAYQRRQCVEFMKLGMQGTSVILASGDSGVAARAADDNNSDGCLGANGEVFSPDFRECVRSARLDNILTATCSRVLSIPHCCRCDVPAHRSGR